MAEKKYDLLLGPKRDSNLKIRNQPWYRERLISKYDRKPKLDASSWTFIEGGLDDFRDGKPRIIDDSIVIKGNKSIFPSVIGSNSFDRLNPKQEGKKLFKKHEAIYSKTIPNQEKRRRKVEDIEKNLLSHPLALYPQIGESVPPDVFEDIVQLIDPSLLLDKESNDYHSELRTTLPIAADIDDGEAQIVKSKSGSPVNIVVEPIAGYHHAIRNVFNTNVGTDSAKLEELSTKEEKFSRTGRRKTLPSQLTHASLSKIDYVTKEFCDWVRGLGGQNYNIEEDTVKNLFASGCETNPIVSAPVHVVELTNVPPDLRSKKDHSSVALDDMSSDILGHYEPSWTKMKYGAWYLDPKLWKARPAGELLQDPKELAGKKLSHSRQKSKELDTVLSSSHGAHAFRKFIEKKGVRRPVFFESIPSANIEDESNTKGRLSNVKTKIKVG